MVKFPNESQQTGFFQVDQIALNKNVAVLCVYVCSHATHGKRLQVVNAVDQVGKDTPSLFFVH